MRTWVGLSAAVAVATTTIVTAGCGSSGSARTAVSANPKAAISASFAKLYDHRSVTFSIHFKDDNGTLLKAMTAGAHSLPGIYAKRIIAGELRITQSAPQGKTLWATRHDASAGQNNLSFAVIDQGSPLFEVLLVSGDLYLRLGVAKLKDLAGGAVDKVLAGLAQVSPALAAGDYVKLPQILKTFHQLATKGAGGIVPAPASSARTSQFATDLIAAFQNVVTYTSIGNGQYGFALDVKSAADAFLSVFNANSASLGPAVAGLAKLQTGIAKIPAGEVTGKVTTKDGAFSALALDLDSIMALARKAPPASPAPSLAGASLALDASFSSDAIAAPATSTPLDISAILSGLLGGAHSLGTTPLISSGG